MLTQVKLGYGHVKNVETCDLERWPTHYQGGMLDLQPRFVSRYRVMWIRLSEVELWSERDYLGIFPAQFSIC